MSKRIWSGIALAVLAQALAGCGGFDELKFSYASAPPDDASVNFREVRIHEGIALGVVAQPLDGGEEMDPETRVELQSQNPGVLGIGPGEPDVDPEDEDQANWNFVLFGVKAGATEIMVHIDGELEAQIPVTVEPQ